MRLSRLSTPPPPPPPPQVWLDVAEEKCVEGSLRLGEVGTCTSVDGDSRERKTKGLRVGGSETRLGTQQKALGQRGPEGELVSH